MTPTPNTINTSNFSNCQQGDKLWYLPIHSFVTVEHVNYASGKITCYYENCGHANPTTHINIYNTIKITEPIKQDPHKQNLYFNKPTISAPCEPPKRLQHGTLMLVNPQTPNCEYTYAIFHHWSKDNNPVCYTTESGINHKEYTEWKFVEHPFNLQLTDLNNNLKALEIWLTNGCNIGDAIQELKLLQDKISKAIQ